MGQATVSVVDSCLRLAGGCGPAMSRGHSRPEAGNSNPTITVASLFPGQRTSTPMSSTGSTWRPTRPRSRAQAGGNAAPSTTHPWRLGADSLEGKVFLGAAVVSASAAARTRSSSPSSPSSPGPKIYPLAPNPAGFQVDIVSRDACPPPSASLGRF